jgi:hypothetical protein
LWWTLRIRVFPSETVVEVVVPVGGALVWIPVIV